jgi:hypothetical protein
MAIYSPIATAYPTIPDSVWTKVNTKRGRERKFLGIYNTDTTNNYRYLKLPSNLTSAVVNATYTASDGKILPKAHASGAIHGADEETYDDLSSGDIWVYQSSGSPLATLAVDEGE